MTVLHISTPTSWRGGEQQLAYLATALHAMEIDQVVLCPEGSALSKKMMEAEIPVATFTSRGILDIKLAQRIAGLCKDKKFDLIHGHDSHAHSGAVLSVALFNNKTPIIVSRRVDFAVSGNSFSKWKYNHPSIRKIVCVSKMIADITAPALRDKSILTVVHSGIDLSKYNNAIRDRKLIIELGLPPATKLIGNLSALAEHKDYPTFLRTAQAVLREDPSLHFIIAGTGPDEKKIKGLAKKLNLTDHIHFLGFREDIIDIMLSLDVFLITSATEGLGTIIIEAFAAGIPVVATRAGGIPELVTDQETGLLADVGDVETLKNNVLQIINDQALRSKIMDNATMRMQDFSYQTTASKTLDVYRAITAD